MIKFQIVSGDSICEFNFFDNGTIYRGAATSDGLYKLIAEYSFDGRSKACALACSLEEYGHHSIVSMEEDGLQKVWTEIRSLIHPVPLIRLDALSSTASS